MSIRWRITTIIAVFTLIAIIVSNVLLAYNLRHKDIAEAKRDSLKTAELIRFSLLSTMIRTGDYDEIAATLQQLQAGRNFRFRMVRHHHVIKQHGIKRNEIPRDDLERQALEDGKVKQVQDSVNSLRIIYPFITDKRCGKCHVDLEGKPVPPGTVNGLAVIKFDLTERQKASEKVINSMMLSLTAVVFIFAMLSLLMVHRGVIKPIQDISAAVMGLQNDNFEINLKDYPTRELRIMAGEVNRTAKILSERKHEHERMIEEERQRNIELKKFVQSRASALGLEVGSEIRPIIGRLTSTFDKADKAEMMATAFKYVTYGESKLVLPTDPELIPAVSVYLGELMQSSSETLKRRTIELALDEALSNAIYHGNMEISSSLKEDDFEKFGEEAMRRMGEEPYRSRRVVVRYEFNRRGAKFIIKDEGAGFDWKKYLSKADSDGDMVHGRGLMIIRALASKLQFNESGNQVTITFDLEGDNRA
ncbi:hypothetical protein MNBD_NITROSPINAE02-211 [hydrothermal vent metagenome]|uniref:Histidine kinase/HSP90-like ATPase domain-containing protein n=1 Tax=hydrothermal vent metagenome TaxID=652676 RepID=A0A3B1CJ70_9ZZZZ